MENGKRIWKEFQDLETDDGEFHEIGQKFEEKFKVKTRTIGMGALPHLLILKLSQILVVGKKLKKSVKA